MEKHTNFRSNVVQQKFEDNVKAALNVDVNPFELIYEGELDKQR